MNTAEPRMRRLSTQQVSLRTGQPKLARLRPYAAYRPSGLPFVGDIPAHWRVVRADGLLRWDKTLIDVSRLADEFVFHYSIPSYQATGDGRLERPEQIDSVKVRVAGERLLVSKLNPRMGVVLVAHEREVPTVCSTEFVPLEVHEAHPRWAFYVFVSDATRQRLAAVVRSATRSHQRAEVSDIVRMWHAVPPRDEQRAIAEFLDRETASIDGLIGKMQRLTRVLEELRTSVVYRAVAEGLDPTVRSKPSGIVGLGRIPEHWHVAPVHARYEIALGKMLDEKRITGTGAGHYLRNANVQWDRVAGLDSLPQMDFTPEERRRYELRNGDLLVCEGGEIGRTATWRGELSEVFYQKAILRVRPRSPRDISRYFFYLMYSFAKRGVFEAGGNPNTINHLTADQLKHHRFPFPPTEEQRAIADLLDRRTRRVDALLSQIQTAIDRLRELRAGLVTAVVVGRVDVRAESVRVGSPREWRHGRVPH